MTKFISLRDKILVTVCYVTLSEALMLNKLTSEAGLLNKSSCFVPALGVTKLISVIDMSLVILCCAT